MPKVPPFLLKKLYLKRSLKSTDEGFEFTIKNVLAEATLTTPVKLTIDGEAIDPSQIFIDEDGQRLSMTEIKEQGREVKLQLQAERTIFVEYDGGLEPGKHKIGMESVTKEYGEIAFSVDDEL